jgi:hypothetical protein
MYVFVPPLVTSDELLAAYYAPDVAVRRYADGAVETDVVVTATLAEGYAWADVGPDRPLGFSHLVTALPSGWVQTSATTATYTVTLPALQECPAPTTTSSPTPGTPLPRTGSGGVVGAMTAAMLLFATGAGLVALARRRVT